MLFEEEKPKELNCKPKFWRASESVNPFPYGTSEYWFWEVEKKIFTSEDRKETLPRWRHEMLDRAMGDRFVEDFSIPEDERVVYFGITDEMENSGKPCDWTKIDWSRYFAGRISEGAISLVKFACDNVEDDGQRVTFRPKYHSDDLSTELYKRIEKKLGEYGARGDWPWKAEMVCRFDDWEKSLLENPPIDYYEAMTGRIGGNLVPAAIVNAQAPLSERLFMAYFYCSARDPWNEPEDAWDEFDWPLYFRNAEEVVEELKGEVRRLAGID